MASPARRLSPLALLAAGVLVPVQAPAADETGTLKGRIVFDGVAPELPPKVAKGANVKDAAVCAVKAIPNHALEVDRESKGVKNVFVYLERAPRKLPAGYDEVPTEPLVFDQKGCEFIPHALFVRAGRPVLLKSQDAAAHNVRFGGIRNRGINVVVPAGSTEGIEVDVTKQEPVPLPVACDFHPWMQGIWFVAEHPYVAVTGADGSFEIEGLPPGPHSFRVWHESAGFLDRGLRVSVKAGETEDVGEQSYKLDAFKALK